MKAVRVLTVFAVFVFSSRAWAQKVEGTAPVNTVPVIAVQGSGTAKTIIAQSPITAAIAPAGPVSIAGNLAVAGMVSAINNITAGGNIVATGNVSGANVSATAGNVFASLDVIAGGNVTANPATGTVSGLLGDFEGSNGGVIGRDTFPTGGHVGVIGVGDSVDGLGVQGLATACNQAVTDTSPCDFSTGIGRTIGVLGSSRSPFGIGVQGVDRRVTGPTTGVLGQVVSPDGIGVKGVNNATTGGVGIVGVSSATSGDSSGVYGQTSSPTGNGVFGNNVTTGTGGAGVTGHASAIGGTGTGGISTTTTGFGTGLYGEADSAGGTAALLNNTAGGTILIGQAAGANMVRVDGSGKGFFNGGTQMGGADFAESMAVRKGASRYEPGDVLVIDRTGRRRVALAQTAYSRLVAGIYSTKPGVLGTEHRIDDLPVAEEIPLAVLGIVPCKVIAENGPINVGDLLVTSSKPGRAMKGTDRSRMLGAVLGKALEPLASGEDVIQVLVTLQ